MSNEEKDIIDQAFNTDKRQELEQLVKKADSITAKAIIREFIEELETD